MQFGKGVFAVTFMLCNAATVWIPLLWWLLQSTWTRGEKRVALRQRMDKIIWWWSGRNKRMLAWLNVSQVEVTWHGQEQMSLDNWYLVISNHQSWTDIVLLQSHLYGVIPPLKFFTKEQLIWVPFIGLAMYVLGFPYVKRVTKEQIKANPKLKTADRDNTMLACEGFKNHPTCILNFVEGTRRTPEKHARQSGEFQYLLRPKVGGLGYVIEGMGTHLSQLLDVTIVYPDGVPTFWEFLQGKCPRVMIDVQPRDIPPQIYAGSETERRAALAQWIKSLWLIKDQHIIQAMTTRAPE